MAVPPFFGGGTALLPIRAAHPGCRDNPGGQGVLLFAPVFRRKSNTTLVGKPIAETHPHTLLDRHERRTKSDTMNIPIPSIEDNMQSERIARAQTALARGEMAVLPLDSVTWLVTSKGNRYIVSLKDSAWACTCPDFAGHCRVYQLHCKHIVAVQIGETGRSANTQNTNPHTEEPMTIQDLPPTAQNTTAPVDEEIFWKLRQPLNMARVKRRQAPGQGTVPFLEGFDVIETANELFRFRWSFDLLGETQILRWEKAVTFYDQRLKKKAPVLDADGKPTTESVGVAFTTGRISIELEGKPYSHADVGRCTFFGDTPEALDMAIAGAATDCLKRCFRQLGEQFGNSLYDKEIAKTAGLENNASNGHGSNGNGHRPTEKTNGKALPPNPSAPPASPAAQSETRQYRDGAAVDAGNAAEVEAFQAFQTAHPGLSPASRSVLRDWVASRNAKNGSTPNN